MHRRENTRPYKYTAQNVVFIRTVNVLGHAMPLCFCIQSWSVCRSFQFLNLFIIPHLNVFHIVITTHCTVHRTNIKSTRTSVQGRLRLCPIVIRLHRETLPQLSHFELKMKTDFFLTFNAPLKFFPALHCSHVIIRSTTVQKCLPILWQYFHSGSTSFP